MTPAWYAFEHAHGAVDFKNHARRPFQVLSGGYAQKFDPRRGWVQVTGRRAMATGHGAHAAEGSRRERRQRRYEQERLDPSERKFNGSR